MTAEFSPFTPGQPVGVELFTGRVEEIQRLREDAADAAKGRFKVAFLSGERGIGKTSLANFVRKLAERHHNMITVHTSLAGVASLEVAIREVFDRLLKTSQDAKWYDKVKDFFGNRVQEVGLFSAQVSFAPKPDELSRLVGSFDTALRRLFGRVSEDFDGMMIVMDDINGLARTAEFPNWLKRFVDTVAVGNDKPPLFLMLVGMEERRRELIEQNESLARIFDLVNIRPWSEKEASDFYRTAFSSVGMTIEDDALFIMTQYTGGLPVLGHEIGDGAFRMSDRNHVAFAEALDGIVSAAEIVGMKHVEPRVMEAIRSARYRSILRTLAQRDGARVFKRKEVIDELKPKEKRVLDNFLRKMRKLGVLEQVPDQGPGYWRFTSNLHYLYFSMEARAQEANN